MHNRPSRPPQRGERAGKSGYASKGDKAIIVRARYRRLRRPSVS